MPGYIEDRWMTKRADPETGKKRRTDRWGKGKRYRVAGIPGVRDRSFAALQDAKDWLATAQTDSTRGEYVDPTRGQMTLKAYVETIWWPGLTVAVSSRSAMKSKIWNHILPHLGQLPLASIGSEHLRTWRAAIAQSLSPNTVKIVNIHLGSILNAAVEDKRILKNPSATPRSGGKSSSAKSIKKGERKARALTPPQVAAVRKHLRNRYQIMADLGVGAGLRLGEALGLSPDDIDEAAGVLHIRRQLLWDPSKPYLKLPKGDKERDVPLSPGLLARLRQHMEQFPAVEHTLPWVDPGGSPGGERKVRLLVTTWFKNPVNYNSFNPDVWKVALAAAGIIAPRDEEARKETGKSGWDPSREYGFHILRHTYASVQLHAGESVVALARWMGHASPDITWKTYAHFMPDSGMRGRSAVDAWLGSGIEMDLPTDSPAVVAL